MIKIAAVFVLIFTYVTFAEVTISESLQNLYDSSPVIVVQGTGFTASAEETKVEVGIAARPRLQRDFDYSLSINDGGIGLTLNLLNNQLWVKDETTLPPYPLLIFSVRFGAEDSPNLLSNRTIIAQILSYPSIDANSSHIKNETSQLTITGKGLIGAKSLALTFNPTLIKNIHYEDVSTYPLQSNHATLRLLPRHFWREDPGPLIVTTVDTGGGAVTVNGAEGVTVAIVDRNSGNEPEVFVLDTSGSQVIYNEEEFVTISGGGFNPAGTEIEFLDEFDLRPNVNYSIVSVRSAEIRVKRLGGSSWIHFPPGSVNPKPLMLHSVYIGGGPEIHIGTNGNRGKPIATVFEQPFIESSESKIYLNLTKELTIRGKGFPLPSTGFHTQFIFSPLLMVGIDYMINMIKENTLTLKLLPHRVWRKDPGPLKIIAMNTRGDDNGWISFESIGGILVGMVEYNCNNHPEKIHVELSDDSYYIYEGILDQSIIIHGKRLNETSKLVLTPSLQLDEDYYIAKKEYHQLILKLKPGKKWSDRTTAPYDLYLRGIIRDDGISFCYNDNNPKNKGIRIAHILSDPIITENFTQVLHESQTKILSIRGTGFSNIHLTRMFLRPVRPPCWSLLSVEESLIRVRLVEGCAWVPSIETLKDKGDDALIYIQVHSMDSGAGEIIADDGITVGVIKRDIPGLVCNDSCVTAIDGRCQDATMKSYDSSADLYCGLGTDCTDCGGVEALLTKDESPNPSDSPTNSPTTSPTISPTTVSPTYNPTTASSTSISSNDPANIDTSSDLLKIGLLLIGCGLLVFAVIKLSQVCFVRGEISLREASAGRYQPVSSISDEDDVEMLQRGSGRRRNANNDYQ